MGQEERGRLLNQAVVLVKGVSLLESVIERDRVRMESQKNDQDHYDDSYQEIYDVCGYIGPTLVCEDKQDNNHVETMSVTRALNVLNISATSTYNLDTKDIAHHVIVLMTMKYNYYILF